MVVSFSYGKENEVKDCFEKINRATFAFNMALDKVLFRPVASGYRKLPSPVRIGTSNAIFLIGLNINTKEAIAVNAIETHMAELNTAIVSTLAPNLKKIAEIVICDEKLLT